MADYYCTDPTYCENGDFKLDPYINQTGGGNSDNSSDILDPTQNDDITLPIPTITTPPFTQTGSNDPNWGKIATGVGIILAVDLFVVAPIVVGLVAFTPELEFALIFTEAWSWPLAAGVVSANVYGWNLIIEGAKGK